MHRVSIATLAIIGVALVIFPAPQQLTINSYPLGRGLMPMRISRSKLVAIAAAVLWAFSSASFALDNDDGNTDMSDNICLSF